MRVEEIVQFQSRVNAMKEVIKMNYPERYEDLIKKDLYWKDEEKPTEYTKWINQNIEKNPNSSASLIIYSLLMNIPIKQLKENMTTDLKSKSK